MVARDMSSLNKSLTALMLESLLILVFFNSSSFFGTTIYPRAIPYLGIIMTVALIVWIWASSRLVWEYKREMLGLQARTISRRQWKATISLIFLLYIAASISELVYPTKFAGEVTPSRLFIVASFTLTFGPFFEEFLFRGYLFRRIQDVTGGRSLDLGLINVSMASIFSGILFGLWHLPTPIAVIYFKDTLRRIYMGLAGFVAAASLAGVIIGEIRSRTESILPGSSFTSAPTPSMY